MRKSASHSQDITSQDGNSVDKRYLKALWRTTRELFGNVKPCRPTQLWLQSTHITLSSFSIPSLSSHQAPPTIFGIFFPLDERSWGSRRLQVAPLLHKEEKVSKLMGFFFFLTLLAASCITVYALFSLQAPLQTDFFSVSHLGVPSSQPSGHHSCSCTVVSFEYEGHT